MTLEDPRGWAQAPSHRPTRVDASADLRVLLATPQTVDELCAPLETRGRLSCRNGDNVVLNAWRWVNGSSGYDDIGAYRRYVINHEVGHALGHPHTSCPGAGQLAPVMLQQSKDLDGCTGQPLANRPRPCNSLIPTGRPSLALCTVGAIAGWAMPHIIVPPSMPQLWGVAQIGAA